MEIKGEKEEEPIISSSEKLNVKQQQIQDLLFSRELGWQEIIYDLINTEQLDPWDVNLTILTDKYLIKIQELEEADFFVSSKVLLAASLLLRIKSEILLNRYIKSIDDILFGKKENKKYEMERINLEEEIPELIPRSPMPRFKKVTLQELMESLSKAITTENRRIQKVVTNKNAIRETAFSLPKRKFSITDKIKEIYERIFGHLENKEKKKKVSFTELVGDNREERVISFYPLLQLENQQRIWLEQEAHFEEIFVWLKEIYLEDNGDPFAEIKQELAEAFKEFDEEQLERAEKVDEEFENPIGG